MTDSKRHSQTAKYMDKQSYMYVYIYIYIYIYMQKSKQTKRQSAKRF